MMKLSLSLGCRVFLAFPNNSLTKIGLHTLSALRLVWLNLSLCGLLALRVAVAEARQRRWLFRREVAMPKTPHAGASPPLPVGEGLLRLHGLDVHYEVLGKPGGGLPIVLTPGGGGGKGAFRWLALRLKKDRQVLLWDRPNCGHSGLTLGDTVCQPEPDLQADYLCALLAALGCGPVILLGKSNGARLSLTAALKRPSTVAALALLNVTGGAKAARKLAAERYTCHVAACEAGGMAAVAAGPHFAELLQRSPASRATLLSFDPAAFMLQYRVWGECLSRGGDPNDFPVTGLASDLLRRVAQPSLCVYIANEDGKDDGMHTRAAMGALHAALPAARPAVVDTTSTDVWVAQVMEFAREIDASHESAAGEEATCAPPLRPFSHMPGFYAHLPTAEEIDAWRGQYERAAALGAAVAAQDEAKGGAASCSGCTLLDPLRNVFR